MTAPPSSVSTCDRQSLGLTNAALAFLCFLESRATTDSHQNNFCRFNLFFR